MPDIKPPAGGDLDAVRELARLSRSTNLLCCLLMDFIPESGSSAGLELTVMRRADLFIRELGLNTWIMTHTYQPRLVHNIINQINLGRVEGLNSANLYDYVQDINRNELKRKPPFIPLPEGCHTALEEGAHGVFILNAQDEAVQYLRYREDGEIPDYVNHVESGKVVSRDHYDPLGFLSSTEELNPETGRASTIRYYRPDGSLALREKYDDNLDGSGNPVICSAQIFRPDGTLDQALHYKDELVAWWLLSLLHDPATHYLVICDHAMYFQRYFIEIEKQRSDYPNITAVESTHNCHVFDPDDPQNSGLGDNYLFLADERQRLDLVVTQTKKQAADLLQRYPAHSYALGSIPNPLTEMVRAGDYRAPTRSRFDIAIAGRLMVQKNMGDALKALALIVKKEPRVKLHIFGEGPLESELKEQAKTLGVSSHVLFHGFQSRLRQALEACALLICTSKHEGFPRIMQESLSVGTPVVSYDCNYGPAEMIEDGINGYLVAPGDYTALAQRVLTIIKDRKLHRNLIKGALHSVRRFTAQAVASRWAQVLLAVLEPESISLEQAALIGAVPKSTAQADSTSATAVHKKPKAKTRTATAVKARSGTTKAQTKKASGAAKSSSKTKSAAKTTTAAKTTSRRRKSGDTVASKEPSHA